ncbi:MAG: ATP-dependent protease ATPase subunit HslU [Sedimentisphaerales bacterium]|nr:ATP-dependent protease ATPase subunit HslU [Sedimentisphaerales bacterium]
MKQIDHLTPRQIVAELDKYIIGQDDAKRAVAIAIRNRWRRLNLDAEIAEEVAPKNIIMAGPTGVGKTEIARRLAALVGAPFVKVEATKFTEVGYVGRDVESMIRDLVERAIQMVHSEQAEVFETQADQATIERILDSLLPKPYSPPSSTIDTQQAESVQQGQERYERTRSKLREQLTAGGLEDRQIEITVEEKSASIPIFSNVGMDQMEPEMQNFLEKMLPSKTARRKVTVAEARGILYHQELDKLIDREKMIETAIERTEQAGIVFLDELDKICGGDSFGPDVSREGVQRDLLPMVEGTAVNTRHGMIHTDHILFIAAGAFSRNKPADLMPELQGRFPIRVKLKDLDQEQFRRILTEPKNSLTRQQQALMETEGVKIKFTDDGVVALAAKAFEINNAQQNIGARRLYAVMEKVLEQISFDAPDGEKKYIINQDYVNEHLSRATDDEDLNIFGFAAGVIRKDEQGDKKS